MCPDPSLIYCHLLCNEGLVLSDGFQVLCCPLCPENLLYALCYEVCVVQCHSVTALVSLSTIKKFFPLYKSVVMHSECVSLFNKSLEE